MPIKNMLDHQIATMVSDVNNLDNSGGSDSAALVRIRTTVSHELLNCEYMEITTRVLGDLENDSAAQRLLAIVNYCSEHFPVEGHILSAVVLPVSIQLRALDKKQMSINTGERGALRDLAATMVETVGARKVTFDTRLYSGAAIYQMKSRDLRAFLQQLDNGIFYPKGGPRAMDLHATSDDASWRLAFFLGVEVIDSGKFPSLNDWPVQLQSSGWCDHISAAIEYADEVLFDEDVQAQAVSHGVFYLGRGLEAGDKGLRSLRMKGMLAALGTDGIGLQIFCTQVENAHQVRTLMVFHLLTLEYKWNLLREETLAEFQRELEQLAQAVLPEFDALCIVMLDEEEYSAKAKEHQVPLFRLVGKSF
jgi:hypothetical protein